MNAESDLPRLLREGTRAWHQRAERSGAMAALLDGRLPRERYAALLHNLSVIYEALEAALASNHREPWLAGLDLAALRRLPALQADLADPADPADPADSPPPTPPLPAALAYAQRLQRLGAAHDAALLAHAYTRYLGDLHGGQILARIVRDAYPGFGTAFHHFGPAQQVLALREHLRGVLAAAPLPAGAAARVVEEACWSFAQHVALFEALFPTRNPAPG
jgi:heme oxygenase (biliverdin-producing, ferredoxin)